MEGETSGEIKETEPSLEVLRRWSQMFSRCAVCSSVFVLGQTSLIHFIIETGAKLQVTATFVGLT